MSVCFPGCTPTLAFMSPISFCCRNNKIPSVIMLLVSRKYCKAGHALRVLGAEKKPVVPGKEVESRAWMLGRSRQTRVAPRSSCCGPGSAGLVPRLRFPGQKGRVPFPPSLSLVRPTRSSGAQIFNYLLLLHLHHGSPDCVQKYLPP